MIQQWNYRRAFLVMGYCVLCSSVLSFFVSIKGHSGFLFGFDAPEVIGSDKRVDGKVPESVNDVELCPSQKP
jgi:hypothetical protein